jgi:dTDP-4-amino-4,6-dideoxygalactose transaminase
MSRNEFLSFSPPLIGEEEIAAVVDVLRSDWLSTGPKTHAFEDAFAAYLGAPRAQALNSCTAGLHSALTALGIGPGDEVITTTYTFCATVNVIEHVGARPVLVDVEPDTLNIDPAQVEAAITPRTKAIIAVHLGGHPAELDALRALAGDRITLIEDAAHALPARYKGQLIGSGTNPVSFSFYATKNLTTGEGGMLTGDPALLDTVRTLSLHGMSHAAWDRYHQHGRWGYDVTMPGYKYNMTDIQAALGLAQLARLDATTARRRALATQYTTAFAGEDAVITPTERPQMASAWHLYLLRLRPERLTITRDQLIEELTARNIGTSVHFIPMHLHSYYREKYGFTPEAFPVALREFERVLSLPLHPRMSDEDAADVITAVRDVVRDHRR